MLTMIICGRPLEVRACDTIKICRAGVVQLIAAADVRIGDLCLSVTGELLPVQRIHSNESAKP